MTGKRANLVKTAAILAAMAMVTLLAYFLGGNDAPMAVLHSGKFEDGSEFQILYRLDEHSSYNGAAVLKLPNGMIEALPKQGGYDVISAGTFSHSAVTGGRILLKGQREEYPGNEYEYIIDRTEGVVQFRMIEEP